MIFLVLGHIPGTGTLSLFSLLCKSLILLSSFQGKNLDKSILKKELEKLVVKAS